MTEAFAWVVEVEDDGVVAIELDGKRLVVNEGVENSQKLPKKSGLQRQLWKSGENRSAGHEIPTHVAESLNNINPLNVVTLWHNIRQL